MESPSQIHDSDGILEIDTLKQFTIPKRKKAKKELFETIALDSREYLQDILQVLKLSYKDRESTRNFSYSRPRLVHNDQLLDEYAEKKKQMRQDGYTEKELQDVYGFLYVETEHEMRRICRDGLRTGNRKISCLGNPKMGVYLSKHADIITAEPLKSRQSGMILLMKIIKGKVKFMVENRSGTPLEPCPNFDCHLLKTSNIDMSAASPQYVYECTQLYLYEYKDDAELSDRPRQVYPFAVVDFRFQGILSRDASRLGPPVLQQQMKSQSAVAKASKKPWGGKTGSNPPHLEPPEPKKAKQKSGDSPGSKNPPQLSSKGELKKTSSAGEKDDALGNSETLLRNAVLWSGELSCDGISIANVQLLSFSLTFKPFGLRQSINVESKVSLACIFSRYLHPLKSFDHKTSVEVEGIHYFYACLVPLRNDDRAFKKFVDYLASSEAGVICNLRNDLQIVIFPDCTASRQLGVSKDSSDFSGLHCIVIMKRSISEYLLGETEQRLQLPNDLESKDTAPPDITSSVSAEEDKSGNSAPNANAACPVVETSASTDSEQTSDSLQIRDPRLRRKPSQIMVVRPLYVVRNRPLVISHSRLVTTFDNMSKLQDKSNIEFARMMMTMNRHGGTSNSQPSPSESAQPTSVFARTETSEAFPRRSASLGPTVGSAAPGSQHPARPPLLGLPDKSGPRGVRPQMPPDGAGFSNPWIRRWLPGSGGPRQGISNRQNQFPGQSSNGVFGEFNRPFNEILYPPGPEFNASSNRQREMLSPRAWEELRKKGHGRDPGQRPAESRPSAPQAEHPNQPGRRNSDSRITGQQGNYMSSDLGQYPADQLYMGHSGEYSVQDPGMMHPNDPRSGEIYGSYDTSRRTTDPQSGLHPGEHQGQDFNRWHADPRHGNFGEYPDQDQDWWAAGQRVRGDWPGQNVGVPASENVRPGLLGDYPLPEANRRHLMESRPGDSSGEPSSRTAIHSTDPRIARRPADPRTGRPYNSKVAEANVNSDERNKNIHSSGAALASVSSSEQS